MRNERLPFIKSLALHGLLAGTMIAMAGSVTPPPSIIHLDSSLLEISFPSQPENNAQPATTILPRRLEAAASKIRHRPLSPAPVQEHGISPETEVSGEIPTATETDSKNQNPAPASRVSTNEIPTITDDEAYKETNFTAIRASILGKLDYPLQARRRGWNGQVEISFTITPDGNVSDLRIVTSSGFSVLDNEALAAIKRSAPFSPPPRSAVLLFMPITFRLN